MLSRHCVLTTLGGELGGVLSYSLQPGPAVFTVGIWGMN